MRFPGALGIFRNKFHREIRQNDIRKSNYRLFRSGNRPFLLDLGDSFRDIRY